MPGAPQIMQRPYRTNNHNSEYINGNNMRNVLTYVCYKSKYSEQLKFKAPQKIHSYIHRKCELKREVEHKNHISHISHHISRTIDLTLFFLKQ